MLLRPNVSVLQCADSAVATEAVLWNDMKEHKEGYKNNSFTSVQQRVQSTLTSLLADWPTVPVCQQVSLYLSSDLLNQQTDSGLATKLWPTNSSGPDPGETNSPGELTPLQNNVTYSSAPKL